MVEPAVGVEPTMCCHDGLQIRYLTVRRRRPIKWYPGRDSNPQVIKTTVFKTVSVAHFDTRAKLVVVAGLEPATSSV